MVVSGALSWVAVLGRFFHAGRRRETPLSAEKAGRLIALGGVAFPVVVLLALLA
ncbi:hypothetical protein GB927_026565 [Shinella sp. CPCC 100929]|uniref:Uncharacterized protein n=1 Tax=Shinella lacus TaxID=2654216 RepID=A0ABT1REK9_9HYPH|nr:hypothetical protein [Shinella lacus]MCQ4633630.1 hypothetical protein [Shinella lacus]